MMKNQISVSSIIRLTILTIVTAVLPGIFIITFGIVMLFHVATIVQDYWILASILYGTIALLELVAASILLTNIKYWLFSIVPQLAVYTLLWFLGSGSIAQYCLIMPAIFAIQSIGLLINYLIRLLFRKIKSLFKSDFLKGIISINSIIRLIIMTAIMVFLDSRFFIDTFGVILFFIAQLFARDLEIALNMVYAMMAFLAVVAASVLLTNPKYWLFSIAPQLAVYAWLWNFSETRPFSKYCLTMLIIFAIQALGVLINFLIRLIIRKIRARKQPVPTE